MDLSLLFSKGKKPYALGRHDNHLSTPEKLFKGDGKPLLSEDKKSTYLAKFVKLQEQQQKARPAYV